MSLPDPKVKFRETLDALIKECNQNIAEFEKSKPLERLHHIKHKAEMAQYWHDRKQTLLEIHQLYMETFG